MTRIEGGVRSSQKIILDEEFRSLLVPHSDAESCELTESLLHYGCRDALTAWRTDGSEMPLLDGYKRYDICTERGIDFRVQPIDLPSREHARLWIESNQLGRRSLTDDVRSVLALSVMERRSKLEMQERAREAGKAGGRGRPKEDSSKDTMSDKLSKKEKPKKNTRAAVAKQAKLPERKLRAIQELKKRAIAVLGEEKAEKLLLQIRHSELSIAQGKRILNKVEAEAKLRAAMAAPVPATEAVDLRVCSMQDLLESVENIDAIITDPPYPKEYLGLYGELGRLAAKALKPGGILAVMCGQSYLPQLLADMSKHMKYRWTIAYLIPGGQAVQLWDRKVNTFWKPILIFGGQPRWLGDVVKNDVNNNDKRFHAWGQSESGVRRLIECLTEPGQLVCDPFLGAGTTAVACAKLARRIVGCDIDELQVEKARSRVKLERLDGDHRQTNIGCGRHIGAYPCCTCIRGDAENLLAGLPPRSVDAVVSDPPYGLDAAAWDRKVPYHLLERFLQVASGTVLWFGAAPAVAQAYTTFDPKPERLLIWSPSFTLSHVIANDLAYRFHALYAWRLPQKHNGPAWDVLATPTERGNWWKHSGTKPLELMRQLVGMVPKNGTILDPFAGSGTTLLAARDRGRHFLGFEINPQHCEVIRHRLYPNTTEAQAFVMASCQRSSACAYSGCVAPGFCSRAK